MSGLSGLETSFPFCSRPTSELASVSKLGGVYGCCQNTFISKERLLLPAPQHSSHRIIVSTTEPQLPLGAQSMNPIQGFWLRNGG